MDSALQALPSVLGAAAVLPPLVYLLSISTLDARPEPPLVVILTFLLGALTVPALVHARAIVEPAPMMLRWLASSGAQAWISTAALEEAAKVLVLAVFSQRYFHYNHPREGMLFGAAVGLGFAAYENLLLVVYLPDAWRDHMVIRSVLTVPVHAALGIIAGVWIARAHAHLAKGSRRDAVLDYGCAWLLPTLLHGLYDFPLLLVRNGVGMHHAYTWVLQYLGFLAATTVIIAATALIYRRASAHPLPVRHPLRHHWWRLHLAGGFAALAGGLMLMIEIQAAWRHEPFALDRHIVVMAGAALIMLAVAYHRRANESTRDEDAPTQVNKY